MQRQLCYVFAFQQVSPSSGKTLTCQRRSTRVRYENDFCLGDRSWTPASWTSPTVEEEPNQPNGWVPFWLHNIVEPSRCVSTSTTVLSFSLRISEAKTVELVGSMVVNSKQHSRFYMRINADDALSGPFSLFCLHCVTIRVRQNLPIFKRYGFFLHKHGRYSNDYTAVGKCQQMLTGVVWRTCFRFADRCVIEIEGRRVSDNQMRKAILRRRKIKRFRHGQHARVSACWMESTLQ